MTSKDILERRIIDFDSRNCKIENEQVILLSPLDFIEGNNLYLPEAVKMPDGRILEDVDVDIPNLKRVLSGWKGSYITLYAGKNYVRPYYNDVIGSTYKEPSLWYLQLPNVNYICLYDDVCEVSAPDSNDVSKFTTKNGILYCDGNVCFVPDRNPFAESAPLEEVHKYTDNNDKVIELVGCGRDLFGGIYTLDGKSFIRWDGHTFVKSYSVRPGVENICNSAFWVETGKGNGDHGLPLREIILPDTLKYIGKDAFRATSLNKLRLPSGVKEIDDSSFRNCPVLETIILPDGIKRLGKFAFAGSAIKSIFIPKSVEYIGDKCFDNCFQLSNIQVDEANTNYSSDDGVLFNADKTSLIRIPPELYPDHPDNCNKIGELSFLDYLKSRSIIIDELTQFDNIYNGVTNISYNVDNNQTGVFTRKYYAIPDTVESIKASAFQGSHIKELFIPKNVVSIGKEQFLYCSFSEIIVSRDNTHFECLNKALIDKDRNAIIYWFGNEEDIVVPSGIEIIGEYAFYNNSFKSLVIPEGVKCVEDHAFSCYSAVSISLPSSLCYISEDAFESLVNNRGYGFDLVITVPHGLSEKFKKLFSEYAVRYYLKELDDEEIVDVQIGDKYRNLAIVSEEILKNSKTDEEGNKYSKDGKCFLEAKSDILYVQEGTEVICEDAIFSPDVVHIPSTVKYIGIDGVFTYSLVIDGKDTYLAGLSLCEDNTIYIPCCTWAMYHSLIESNMMHSNDVQCRIAEDGFEDFKKKFDEYRMIEISKSNFSLYLQQQKSALLDMINQGSQISVYSIKSINGVSSQSLALFRTINSYFIFNLENGHFIELFGNVIFLLGYSLQDICNVLQVNLSEIEVNEGNIDNLIDKTLARRVIYSWAEEILDEDSGEMASIDRCEVIFEPYHRIDRGDVQTLLDYRIKKVYVYDGEVYRYSDIKNSYPVSKDDFFPPAKDVLDFLFIGKDISQVTEEERLLMGYNLLTAYKALADYYGYVEDVIIPFKIKNEDLHSETTPEEKYIIDLIEEFYDHKISAIKDCKTDLDVMPLFTPDEETKRQLVGFLQRSNVSERLINLYVNQFFDRYIR